MPFHESETITRQKQLADTEGKIANLIDCRSMNAHKMRKSSASARSESLSRSLLSMSLFCKMTFTTVSSLAILSLIILQTTPSNAHSLLQDGLNLRHPKFSANNHNNNNNNEVQPNNHGPMNNHLNNLNANSNNNNNIDNNIGLQTGHLAGSHHRVSGANAISLNGGYQNRCPSGWMWFNNKCWVATLSRRDFSHAADLCKKLYNSSTLPTIHTEEENEFLRQKLDLKNSPIWLHARHNHQYNKTRWMDRTGVNYTNWDAGQPSDKASLVCIRTEDNWYMKKTELKDGQTECVSFWEDGKWGTQVGCQVLLPVVCEKRLTAMAKYQIQPNGSEPSFDSINAGSLGHGSAASLFNNRQNQLMLFVSIIGSASFVRIRSTSSLVSL